MRVRLYIVSMPRAIQSDSHAARPAPIVGAAQRLKRERDQARHERDRASEERSRAIRERDRLSAQLAGYEALLGLVLSAGDEAR